MFPFWWGNVRPRVRWNEVRIEENVPELPEVETLRRNLEREVLQRRIIGATIANAKILKGQAETAFCERALGKKITRITRRGKYILAALEEIETSDAISEASAANAGESDTPPVFLCIHLKMRGQLTIQKKGEPVGPYHCLTLLLDNDEELRYHDMWTWGEIRVLTSEEAAKVTGLVGMGPEPLDDGWDGAALTKGIGKRRGPIKPILLDQKTVAGIGNIYADESLFRAGIHPERSAASLTTAESQRLAQAIRMVLTEAIAGGGTEGEFVDTAGGAGGFIPQVYDQGGKPCPQCGTPLQKIRLGGRGTAFCANCQPADAQRRTKELTEIHS